MLVGASAGDRELFDDAAGLLEVMGKKSFFLGAEVGLGAKMKLVINMVPPRRHCSPPPPPPSPLLDFTPVCCR